jgi:NAD(P)H-nitrite reductase large subunit
MVLKKTINQVTKESPQPKKQTKAWKSKSPINNQNITTKTGDKPVITITKKKTTDKNELMLCGDNNHQLITTDNINVLEFYKDKKEDIERIIEWFKNVETKEVAAEVHKVEIKRNEMKGKPITRSFRLYESVAKKFDKFAEQHKEITITDLLNQMIIEYVEKYSK